MNIGDTPSIQSFVESPIMAPFIVVHFVDVDEYLRLKALERGIESICGQLGRRAQVPEAGALFLHDAEPVLSDGKPEAFGEAALDKLLGSIGVLFERGCRHFDPAGSLLVDVVE